LFGVMDLTNQTSLLEAGGLLAKAHLVLGVDNGLLHLAACSDVPILAGFTTVEPWLRTPVRQGVDAKDYWTLEPPEELDCRFCQSSWNFMGDWRFTKCFYGDLACVKSLSAERWIERLEEILKAFPV
jgi:ADP-heptose:LPS heptosyltransferase